MSLRHKNRFSALLQSMELIPRMIDLPGKEFAGRPDSAWINPSYETLSSFLRLMRKLPSVSFAKEIKPRARKAGLEIELALLWRQVKKSRG